MGGDDIAADLLDTRQLLADVVLTSRVSTVPAVGYRSNVRDVLPPPVCRYDPGKHCGPYGEHSVRVDRLPDNLANRRTALHKVLTRHDPHRAARPYK